MYKLYIKRLIDIFISISLIFALLPLFIMVTLVLSWTNRGSPFFIQLRPGKNNNIFYLVKFKTMNSNKDENGNLLTDNERITKFGRILRRTSIDELPQLLNVFLGDMSLVGPRPLLVEYLPLYNKLQALRHTIRPGITGWAQVKGRNAISWEERLELDSFYVIHISFLFDLKILFMTVWKVFICAGISSNSSETMEKFCGTKV